MSARDASSAMSIDATNHVNSGIGDSYLELRHVTKAYRGQEPVVNELNLSIRRGDFVSLLGASGCGKTTTLRMIAGLIEPTFGSIRVDGNEITALPPHKRNIGVVFQSYALFPHLTVAENVAFALRLRREPRSRTAEKVKEALQMVQLEALGDRKPGQLSGGQQQRVALARALVFEPALLLMDEPLSNLDAKLRDSMRDEIRKIQQALNITAIFVTHDQSEALTMSDKIAVMHKGAVVQFATPHEIYEKPSTAYVAEFVGSTNSFVAQSFDNVGESHLKTGPITFVDGQRYPSERSFKVLVRPHHVDIQKCALASSNSHPNSAIGTVEQVTYSGVGTSYRVRVGDWLMAAEVPMRSLATPMLNVSDRVKLSWESAHVHCFAQ